MSIELPPLHTPGLTPEQRIHERRELAAMENATIRRIAQQAMSAEDTEIQADEYISGLKLQSSNAAYTLLTELDRDFEHATVLTIDEDEIAAWRITHTPESILTLYLTRYGELAGVRDTAPASYDLAYLDLASFNLDDLVHISKDLDLELDSIRLMKRWEG